ncbi:hypothetical protein HKD37_01G000900 [Glycine soja]
MGDQEETQEQMKADMSALKEQMASMMEAMLSMKQLIEKNAATAAAVSSAAEADPTLLATTHHPPSNIVGRGRDTLGHDGSPHLGYNRAAYPYGLPPNYSPPVLQEDAGHIASLVHEREPPQQPDKVHKDPQDYARRDVEFYPPIPEGPAPGTLPQPNIAAPPIVLSTEGPPPAIEERRKLDLLEERLRAVEGFGDYPFADMTDLYLVPDVVIPPKFKVPDFDKYKGTTCPKNHLKMYCRKMGAHSKDEKLLIHFFQDSLARAAVVWYTNLEASHIRTWKDLITAFLRQYQYNSDMAPDRTQLQNMFKKEGETFKEYAQRWRDLAAQVAPPMVERKMITMMVDTLPVFYYEKLVGYMPSSFADLVFAGERIEVGLKRGKFDYVSSTNANAKKIGATGAKRKEGDAHAVSSTPAWVKPQQTPHGTHQYAQHHPSFSAHSGNASSSTPVQPKAPTQREAPQVPTPNTTRPAGNSNTTRNFPPRPFPEFTPLPMTYEDLLPSLIANHLAVVTPGRVLEPPFPKWYDPNATCKYHGGVPGHSVEKCLALKYKVQHLMDAGWLTFQEDRPNVRTNPLANHGGGAVNAVESDRPHRSKPLRDVATPRRFIFEALQKGGVIPHSGCKENSCLLHSGEMHDMETCLGVEELLQRMIDQGRLEVGIEGKEEQHICMQSTEGSGVAKPKPLVIYFTKSAASQKPGHPLIAKPVPFPYQNSHAVPWRYTPPREKEEEVTDVSSLSAKVTNITGLSGVTRSGRVFAPPDLPVQPTDVKGKGKVVEEQDGEAPHASNKDIPAKGPPEKKDGKKEVSLEEASEFLRIIQQSEFKVIEQLNKTLARVSLLELLMSSEPHRALLVKVLNEAHVAQDILVEGFGGLVNNITANNYLAFAEEEIPAEGRGHNKALHVSVKCMDHIVAKVLIDNGSSLNVMPKSTLEKLPFNASHLKPSSMVVRAFNASHSVGVVPSTLHQKLKFVVEGHLVIVSGEEDILVSCPSSMPYVEAAEESLETAFQSFEVVSISSVDSLFGQPCLSDAAVMMARVMLGNGYEPGMGLGKDNGGITSLINTQGNRGKYGLGYKPTQADMKRSIAGRKNSGQSSRWKQESEGSPPCHISRSFISAGLGDKGQVFAICEDDVLSTLDLVRPCPPDFQLGNWRVEERPGIYATSIMDFLSVVSLVTIFQRNERGFEALVLTLVSNLALICDHLSPSAQFMGCPKRLIRIEPEPTFPKFAAFENIHAYAYTYACILLWYLRTDASGDGVTTDRSLPLICAKQAENVAARQPRKMLIHEKGGDMEMAPRKLASKRSRRDKAAEGTSSAPEYDSHRFRSAVHQQRFEAIKGWSFLRERRVQLRDDEYTDFQEEIGRRRWASLVTPMAKFDPEIVLEFYANAWPTEEGVRDMRSWVRGQWIPFDADAIGQLLGYPLVLEEGQECEYGQRRNRSDGFDEEAIAQLLCIPGQDFARTAAGRRVRIMRTNMTTLTQIWMTLLLSNILPTDHNSDLPMSKCQLVYAILTRMSIHVAQLIADAIYIFAGMAPTRHPLDPDKSNRALGFPALITGLCQSFGVPVAPTKVIRPPITRAFIEKYCTQRQAQGDAPQAAGVPPPPHQAGQAGAFDMEQYLRHLVRQQAANHRAHVQTHNCLYQMSLSMQSQGFASFSCPTPDQFRAEVAWPGDWPEAQAGEAPPEAPGDGEEAHEDEEMADLLDFLGGSGDTWNICLFAKACLHFSGENTETFSSLTSYPELRRSEFLIGGYVGARASLLSTTPPFVAMTQELVARGDTLRLSAPRHSVTPSVIDEQRPMWSSAPFPEMSAFSDGDFFKSHKLSRTTGGGPDDTQRYLTVIRTLLSSRGGGPDDKQRQNLVILHPCIIQRRRAR